MKKQRTAREVPCRDGAHRAVGALDRSDRAAVPQPAGASAGSASMSTECCACTAFNIDTAWPTEALEDALHDSQALRHFVGIDLSHKVSARRTTPPKFRDC